LIRTSLAGRINLGPWLRFTQLRSERNLENARGPANEPFALATHITGPQSGQMSDTGSQTRDYINVIYVADADILSDFFVDLRNNPIRNSIEYGTQNMSFVQNVLDVMAGEETYLGIRNRRVTHVSLETIDKKYVKALDKVYEINTEAEKSFQIERSKIDQEFESRTNPLKREIESLEKKKKDNKPYDAARLERKKALLFTETREQQARKQTRTQELNIKLNEEKRQTNLTAELEIQKIQQLFKLCAVVIPPVPPLILGVIVFFRRRLLEREGISKARRLK